MKKDIDYRGGHDITHCPGGNCPLQKKCVRYIAHLDMKNYPWPVSYVTKPPYDYDKKECDLYWKIMEHEG